ncbi:hypothetical protein HMPREF0389_01291 [Filifactor alocis ATCC 35896]|uniref:Uncharacterized protein n=1 Tax=Filifactor alocis (strain ATCC 35896 / CCUG 47790 / D40 B5) TaxID=546269 RepID=D6GT53_FILAD|nr:hypothetical protein [Filifactor alocis]EFE28038.1 hypothetical protein HMPREF0389_01291 [Filifactor alocis ATCC 35896]
MWVLFGVAAIVFAVWNVIFDVQEKKSEYLRFLSMAFTSLTLCAFYHECAEWILQHDWIALEDVVPAMSKALWILTILSILLNSSSLWKKTTDSDRIRK